MRSHNHTNSEKTQLFGVAAVAAGVGALTALLFTDRSGAEIRQALRTRIHEAKSKPGSMKEEISEAADNAKDMASKAKAKTAVKAKAATRKTTAAAKRVVKPKV